MNNTDNQAGAPQEQAGLCAGAPSRGMSGSPGIAVMSRALGHQLAALRQEAGLTQQELGALAGFSRSAVSVAEIGRRAHARQFWSACDKALQARGVLEAGLLQIEAVREEQQRAAARAAQQAREAQALAALSAARQGGGITAAVTAVQACPHCGQHVTVLTTLTPAPTAPPAPPAGR